MKDWLVGRRRIIPAVLVLSVIALSVLVLGFKASDSDYFLKISKSIDIFGRVYKEVTMNYVDEVDPEKFIEAGIDGMLGTLDPYTNFIDEKESDEVELITVGKYGGIGVTIGLRDGFITIISLMEGYSAQRQGLQPGDRILEIDDKPVTGMKPESIRSLTRGEPGTEVKLKVDRDGEKKPLEFSIVREEIQLKNISYADFIGDDGIVYVHMERFSRSAGDELRLAIRDLKLKHDIRGMILDLRDNPGGLLDEAVNVVEKFVPKGSLVVSTKGRQPGSEKKFYVTENPMLPDIPLIVLVNHGSASASEIVSGAIQDLDRGIILGTRTFGKGLVQTITPLVYNTQLKITTAKYYTPSGRCIQEIDYTHRNKDGVFAPIPDSLRRQFKTLKGRVEYEAGGIQPDTVVNDVDHSSVYNELLRRSMYFKFATHYAAEHKELPRMFETDNAALLSEFQQYLRSQKFTFQEEGEAKLKELTEIADKSKYSPVVRQEIERLEQQIEHEKTNSVDRNSSEILDALRPEIVSRYQGEHGRIEESLSGDIQVKAAVGLLKDREEYSNLLTAR